MHAPLPGRVSRARATLGRSRALCVALVCACLCFWQTSTHAQSGSFVPASGDLLLRGRPAEGLLVLRSGLRNSRFVDVDALVFIGASSAAWSGDVLSVSVLVREPHGLGQVRLGRFIIGGGAVGPVQMDGAELVLRPLPGSSLGLFAGLPVVPEFGSRSFDWLAGGRLGQTLWADRLGLGVSYVQRRDAGERDAEELGADASLHALSWLSLNALASWSLIAQGFSQLRAAALANVDPVQIELFAMQRIAARLLPATSLFSVISDTASTVAGGAADLRAFPRLNLGGTLAVEGLGSDLGYRTSLRATLRLADEGPGKIGFEAMRRHRGADAYTGAALRVEVPINLTLTTHAIAELVRAEQPRGGVALWPWVRVGASWALSSEWLLGAALGVQASPLYAHDVYALVRVGYRMELQP